MSYRLYLILFLYETGTTVSTIAFNNKQVKISPEMFYICELYIVPGVSVG
jgi:hypothetical protein